MNTFVNAEQDLQDSIHEPAGTRLLVNHLIQDKETNEVFRILYLPKESGQNGFWIQTSSKSNIPKPFCEPDVLLALHTKRFEIIADTKALKDEEPPSRPRIELRDRSYNLIKDLVAAEPDIFDVHIRAQLLKQTEERTGVKANNLYGFLGRYWRGGKTIDALLPDFNNCGGHRTGQSIKTRQGRPKRAGMNGKVLTEKDYGIFEKSIKEFYTGKKKSGLTDTYQYMLDNYYVRPSGKDDPRPVSLNPDEKPSLAQFRYWFKMHTDTVETKKEKEGEHLFNLLHRSVTGKSETRVYGPGMACQIDATIGDYYLVRKHHRESIVGRPVMFFVKDIYSRMIIGMHITLENASWNAAMRALHNTVNDKVSYCRRYGIEITPDEWPCRELPAAITADNGEMGDKGVEDAIARLAIMIENTPPYRGDLKGIIEKNFDLINLKLRNIVPGHVEKDAGTRGADDYRQDACVDFDTFVYVVIRSVLFYNNHHYMDYYEKTPQMRQDKVRPIPLELWNYGKRHISGALRMISEDDIKRILLPRDTAKVTEAGIYFHGLYYTCQKAESENWFSKANIFGRRSIPVLYEQDCVDNIYIPGDESGLVTCSLVDKSLEYAGLSHDDMDVYKEEDAAEKAGYNQAEDQARAEFSYDIRTKLQDCLTAKESRSKIKKALSRESIDLNRTAEREELSGAAAAKERQAAMGIGTGQTGTGSAASSPHTDEDRTMDSAMDDLLGNLMKEAGLD